MNRNAAITGFFRATSALTDVFPQSGSRFLNATLLPIAGNDMLAAVKVRSAQRKIDNLRRLSSILVVSDLNIGDALFSQALVAGLRDFFPEAVIDLAISRAASRIVLGNPDITGILPVFSGRPLPADEDMKALRRVTTEGNYDFVLSICPYFRTADFGVPAGRVVDYSTFASVLVNSMRKPAEIGHVVYQLHRFIGLLFDGRTSPRNSRDFKGVRATLPMQSVEEAAAFLRRKGVGSDEKIIIVNPDASTRFTTVPAHLLAQLLRKILKLNLPILLGSGHTELGTVGRILGMLAESERKRIVQIDPGMSLEVYSSLLDFSRIYVTGDSGPLHIAAAEKITREDQNRMRNATSVLSIFGATPCRTYAYDSRKAGFFPANQDALSYAHMAESPCRNVTCINKLAKNCRSVRCFEVVDLEAISNDIETAVTLHQHSAGVESRSVLE